VTNITSLIRRTLLFAVLATALLPALAAGQTPAEPDSETATPQNTGGAAGVAQTLDEEEDDPAVLDPAEPDFVVINIPTNLRLPRFKGNFRLTHRFAGNLRSGSFSQNASNLFGLDQGAIIGFEYRINLMRDLQAAVFRTNFDKTFQFYGKYDAIRQRGSMPVSISGIASIEGTNNFQDKYAPAAGVVISRQIAERLALYAAPIWVGHTNASLEPIEHDHDTGAGAEEEAHDHERRGTVFVGLGARARLTSTVYLVGEMSPRTGGYAPDEFEYGFGIEKRVGGHAFALTFTNTFGTTFAQLARGGAANTLYLGFNLGRKFF
jgi:hypothetical protein